MGSQIEAEVLCELLAAEFKGREDEEVEVEPHTMTWDIDMGYRLRGPASIEAVQDVLSI